MTSMEFWLAWLFNIRGPLSVVAIVLSIATIALLIFGVAANSEYANVDKPPENGWSSRMDYAHYKAGVKWAPRAGVLAFVLALLSSMPGPDDLWRLRISLLKLEVASPENLSAAKDHLEVIVKGLECKYLNENCPKVEKK